MEVKHKKEGNKGIFYLEENESILAELVYVFAGETKFIIEHTEVKPGNEGKGFGKKLVLAAVDFARKNKYKILPLCPYARSVLEKSEDYKDVLF
jgi:uncharacterized protein